MPPALTSLAAAAPSTPLGPFVDSAVAWTTWVTLMGLVGLIALAVLSAGPAAARTAPSALAAVTARLARAAAVVGVLAVPAVLTDLAHGASHGGGYDYSAAWDSLYDGSNAGRLSGLEVTLSLVAAALVAPLAVRSVAAGRARSWLLGAGLVASSVALGTTKFPTKTPADWGRTSFETLIWMLHLLGGGIWLGGLAGLLLLAAPGAIPAVERRAFWSMAIRRFSVSATSCVAAITLSGLFLYWEHVDGLSQLVTTMYGRVLGVKILIFGGLLLLGMFNQFWLHPRIDAARDEGDQRPLVTVLLRRFPLVVAVEVLLGMTLLFVAPFLHGSARNQAYQAQVAEQSATAVPAKKLPKLAAKQVGTDTWVWGTAETVAVVVLMAGGYRLSGRLAGRRTAAAVTSSPLPS
ncbi:CopD family protein [Saccharothrix sp. ST-888]|uniref:CopD family protein n=1 Tax=Saccharothrix sp. ST-888 TaxID=1427391 RepID=UPI0005EC4473|nr:CopD family protein [Saccharothrix sp. ST-888]KJK56881.1 copper resistance protein CopD [Saccharothrix sp. ST-888]